MLGNPPLVLDNTLVTKYGLCGRFDILEKLYGGHCIIPTEIVAEAFEVRQLKTCVQQALTSGWLTEHTINFSKDPNQFILFTQLTKRVDRGEAAVLAIAQDMGATAGTDDMRAAATYCKRNSIPLLGTYGILFHAYTSGIITIEQGTNFLTQAVSSHHQRLPVLDFNAVTNWFQSGVGKQLY